MKNLLKNSLLLVLLSISILFTWQNHQLRHEKTELSGLLMLAEEEIRIEKLYHKADFEANIMRIEQLEKQVTALQASAN